MTSWERTIYVRGKGGLIVDTHKLYNGGDRGFIPFRRGSIWMLCAVMSVRDESSRDASANETRILKGSGKRWWCGRSRRWCVGTKSRDFGWRGKISLCQREFIPSQLTHLTFQQRIWKAFWDYLRENRSMVLVSGHSRSINFCGCIDGKSSSSGHPERWHPCKSNLWGSPRKCDPLRHIVRLVLIEYYCCYTILLYYNTKQNTNTNAMHIKLFPPPPFRWLSGKRLQNPLCLINLQSQIRRPPSIRMIRQHNRLIPFRQLLSRYIPLTKINTHQPGGGTLFGLWGRLLDGSFLVQSPLWGETGVLGVFLGGLGSVGGRGDRLGPRGYVSELRKWVRAGKGAVRRGKCLLQWHRLLRSLVEWPVFVRDVVRWGGTIVRESGFECKGCRGSWTLGKWFSGNELSNLSSVAVETLVRF